MRTGHYVWSVVHGLVLMGAVAMLGCVVVAMLVPLEPTETGFEPSRGSPKRAASGVICDTTEVMMDVAEGRPFSLYSMRDREGRELLRIMYRRSGRIVLTWGEGYECRAGCSAEPGGLFELWAVTAESNYSLMIKPDATSGVTLSDRRGNLRDGLGLTPDGMMVRGQSILD